MIKQNLWKNKSATLCGVADGWYLSDESDMSDKSNNLDKSNELDSQTGRNNYAINGGSSVRRLPLGCGALGVDHDALDEDHDHHELDALALHNPLVSLSMP